MKILEQKTAIITGAASGMGRAMALLFARQGANVVVSDISAQGAADVATLITSEGNNAVAVAADVSNEHDVETLINTAISSYSRLDVLVNNAGILDDFMPVDVASTTLWNRVMGVNVNGPFYACRLAVPIMLKQGGGAIINIASVGGLNGARAGAAYTTSKHALVGLTKNIGFMYAQQGIRCNAIAPGGVETNIGVNMHPNPLGYEKLSLGLATNPRMGKPEEIAELALFLASDKASFINGTVITADGGWTAY